jgi:hypothetical protein
MKMQLRHYNIITKISKVLNDIEDASSNYVAKVQSIDRDLDSVIRRISVMEPSLEFLDDNPDNVESKKSDLTYSKLNPRKYDLDQSKFRYKMVRKFRDLGIYKFIHN